MTFDAQAMFANLAEKERLYGHHSAEGRAIRTLSRALNGWSVGDLPAPDVIVLCDRAMEDWLKARLKVSQWSAKTLTELMAKALKEKLLTRLEAVRLQRIHNRRTQLVHATLSAAEVEAALAGCIQIVEKHWS
jgi:hypothetical protein